MKRSFQKYTLALIVMAGTIIACTKQSVDNAPYSAFGLDTVTQASLKFIYASAYTANPSVILKINGKAVSNSITSRTPFPGGGYNTTGSNYPLYLSVPKGVDTISVIRPKVGTSDDSIVLYKTTITLPDAGPYTLHITDTFSTALNKTASLLVKNDISTVDTGRCRYRFVNLMPNVPSIDLYLNGIKVDSNIAYLQAGKAFTLRTGANAPGVTDPNSIPTPSWTIRPAGAAATSTALATYASASTMLTRKVYTVFAMGYQGATGTRLPYVSFTMDKNN